MKVIIPTKNRQGIISTHTVPAFENADVYVLVHSDEQCREYIAAGFPRRHANLLVTGTEPDTFGLTRQREWACKNLVEPGEWFVFADDNITGLAGPPIDYRKYASLPVKDEGVQWRDIFNTKIDPLAWRRIFAQDTMKADNLGAHLVGFATTGNHFFRGRKWRPVGYVIGKMMLWKNEPYRWDHTISMEDFGHTAEHLLRHGAVLIDNFVFPECTHYQPGGMGTYLERVPQRRRDVVRLMEKYPGVFRVKDRKDFEPNTDLAVRFNSEKQVQEWRFKMGVLG